MPLPNITPRQKKFIQHTDFFKTLKINRISKDIALKTNEDSISEAIKNLILTDKGERKFQPLLGGNIRAMLFENMTPAIIKIIKDQIQTTIREYEPRAEVIDVIVKSNIDDNNIQVTIQYYAGNNAQPVEIDVFLERIR